MITSYSVSELANGVWQMESSSVKLKTIGITNNYEWPFFFSHSKSIRIRVQSIVVYAKIRAMLNLEYTCANR